MDLTLSAAQEDLRERARALTDSIMAHELACEEQNGLSAEAHREIADRVPAHERALGCGLAPGEHAARLYAGAARRVPHPGDPGG